MRGVSGVRDGSSDSDSRRKWQTVSVSAGGGVRGGGGTGNGGRWERGQSEAAWSAE